jgi:hypothetical protein
MRVKSLKVFVRILMFGLVLGASSTAYADAVAIASISFTNLQFTPTAGTALFAPTGATARAQAANSLGENVMNSSNTVPNATANATVTFANASATANTTNRTLNSASLSSVGACTCIASSIGEATLTGTLVVVGGTGNVDVTISGLIAALGQATTTQSGLLAEAEVLFNLTVNGVSVFSTEFVTGVIGPNQTVQVPLSQQLAQVITVQFGAVNTIGISVSSRTLAINEIPEPATMILLVSGLGFMTGVLKKRRKSAAR